jgi:hypothetical protein
MKKAKRQWIEREFPTEEEVLADLSELLSALMHNVRDFTAEEAAAAAMVFLAPSIRKALTRAKIEEEARLKAGDKRGSAALLRKRTTLALAARLQAEQDDLRKIRKKHQLAISVHKKLTQLVL